jgi:capsular polysaccharide transport system permease protein
MTKAETIVPAEPVPSDAHILGSQPVRKARTPWWTILTFLFCVGGTAGATALYLWQYAADRYASRTAFSIRSNESTAPLEIFGSITQLGTSSARLDGEILYDFIQSQQLLDAVRTNVDLEQIYNSRQEDPIFTLGIGEPVEELLDHWALMTDVAIDPATGILSVEARAFSAEDAHAISEAVLQASADLVNEISEAARKDAVHFAALELEDAEQRLRLIRTKLRAFRDIEQEVDPTLNAQAALDLVATLEEDRARTQVQLDQLTGVLDAQAPRIQALRRRIATLDARISEERTRLGTGKQTQDAESRPLADVVGDYEELVVDREFAEQAYTLAMATYEQAQAEARRRNRFLAVHIRPTKSDEAEYPDRIVWLLTMSGLAFAIWAIGSLLLVNIREHR